MLLYSELLRAMPLIKTQKTNQTKKRPRGRFFVIANKKGNRALTTI